MIDRTWALSETNRTELFSHSLSETTELNQTELCMNFTLLSFGINPQIKVAARFKKKKIKLAARILKKKIQLAARFLERKILLRGKTCKYCWKTLKKSLKITKFATAELAKLLHSLGETELTEHWQKVRPKFGRTESSVDHYYIALSLDCS